MSKEKLLGQVFTPPEVVSFMLDEVGYVGSAVLSSRIMEPSFGQGVFLKEIVKRIITEGMRQGLSTKEIQEILEMHVYGVEIDPTLHSETSAALDGLLSAHGIPAVKWNLICGDTLDYAQKYAKSFDFVVGNPPYVRIHNLGAETRNKLKSYRFTSGNTDLYIAFFELGIRFLNRSGRLIYITPNSWLRNTSQGKFREFLHMEKMVRKIINFKSSAVFEDAATYAAITYLAKGNQNNDFTYSSYAGSKKEYSTLIKTNDYWKSGTAASEPWNFGDSAYNARLVEIRNRKEKISKNYIAQHGVTTNRDKVYIYGHPEKSEKDGVVIFNGMEVEEVLLRPVIKGSSYRGGQINSRILFPYVWDESKRTHVPIDEFTMLSDYPLAYDYLKSHEETLRARDMDAGAKTWYQFARSQGLTTIGKPKLVFGHVIAQDKTSLEVYRLGEDVVVYSGVYVTGKNGADLGYLQQVLSSEEFCWYAKAVGKDMSGGYKSISAKVVGSFGLPDLS